MNLSGTQCTGPSGHLARALCRTNCRFDRSLIESNAQLVSNHDAVSSFRKTWSLGSNPMSDETGVLLGFLLGPAFMSQEVTGRKLSYQVKEKPLHGLENAAILTPFRLGRHSDFFLWRPNHYVRTAIALEPVDKPPTTSTRRPGRAI